MVSRDAWNARIAATQAVERREGRVLAAVSVGLGLGQLAFLRWADRALAHRTAVALEGTLFLLYLAVVAWLLWRYQTHRRAVAPRCPGCGALFDGLSLRLATATGRCDRCGAQAIAD